MDKNTTEMKKPILILSDDVLRELILFLPVEDLFSVLLANRRLNQIADSETQWRLFYLAAPDTLPPVVQSEKKAQQRQRPRTDKMFPCKTWKYNVLMTRQHRWSPHLMDSKGNKIMNPQGPIIDERGKLFRFTANDDRQVYRITNATIPHWRGRSTRRRR